MVILRQVARGSGCEVDGGQRGRSATLSEILGHSEQLTRRRLRLDLMIVPWPFAKRRSLRDKSRSMLAERLKADLDLTVAMRAHDVGLPNVAATAETTPGSGAPGRASRFGL